MNDYKIIVDAGHGGNDPGAVGNGIVEKDLNLKLSQYLYNRFRELGIPVKITRTTDETLSPDERIRRIQNAYNDLRNVIILSNHINAGGGDGAEVIYPLRNSSELPDLILAEMQKVGQNVRDSYQRRLPSNPSRDYYFMQRETSPAYALTVEYGFLDSSRDDVNQLKNNSNQLAEAVVRAVLRYIGHGEVPIGDNQYVVKKGDSLYNLAQKFNTTVDILKRTNNLTSNLLNIGQILTIPSTTPPLTIGTKYTVKSGDNLYDISRKYNTTVQEIMNYNNLRSNLLTIGQVLTIPTTSRNQYTVQSGDSLYSIAKRFNTTVDEIKIKNNLTSNLLRVGQTLII